MGGVNVRFRCTPRGALCETWPCERVYIAGFGEEEDGDGELYGWIWGGGCAKLCLVLRMRWKKAVYAGLTRKHINDEEGETTEATMVEEG